MQTPQKKRLDSLEAANMRLAEQVAHLEQEAAASSAALRERADQASSAAERAAAADAEVVRLQAEVESHEKQIALLEVRLILSRRYTCTANAHGLGLATCCRSRHALLSAGESVSPHAVLAGSAYIKQRTCVTCSEGYGMGAGSGGQGRVQPRELASAALRAQPRGRGKARA